MTVANTKAYNDTATITGVKSFIVGFGVMCYNFFTTVEYLIEQQQTQTATESTIAGKIAHSSNFFVKLKIFDTKLECLELLA